MKNIVLTAAIVSFSIAACTDPKNHTNPEKISSPEEMKATEVKAKPDTGKVFPIQDILSAYLQLKKVH